MTYLVALSLKIRMCLFFYVKIIEKNSVSSFVVLNIYMLWFDIYSISSLKVVVSFSILFHESIHQLLGTYKATTARGRKIQSKVNYFRNFSWSHQSHTYIPSCIKKDYLILAHTIECVFFSLFWAKKTKNSQKRIPKKEFKKNLKKKL